MENNRRDFIRKMGTPGGAGLLASSPILAIPGKNKIQCLIIKLWPIQTLLTQVTGVDYQFIY